MSDYASVNRAEGRAEADPSGVRRFRVRGRGFAAKALLAALPIVIATACGGGAEETEPSGSNDGSSSEKSAPRAQKVKTWQLTNSDRGPYDFGLGVWASGRTRTSWCTPPPPT